VILEVALSLWRRDNLTMLIWLLCVEVDLFNTSFNFYFETFSM